MYSSCIAFHEPHVSYSLYAIVSTTVPCEKKKYIENLARQQREGRKRAPDEDRPTPKSDKKITEKENKKHTHAGKHLVPKSTPTLSLLCTRIFPFRTHAITAVKYHEGKPSTSISRHESRKRETHLCHNNHTKSYTA